MSVIREAPAGSWMFKLNFAVRGGEFREYKPLLRHLIARPSSLVVRLSRPASVTSPLISTVWSFKPYKPYIFWKIMTHYPLNLWLLTHDPHRLTKPINLTIWPSESRTVVQRLVCTIFHHYLSWYPSEYHLRTKFWEFFSFSSSSSVLLVEMVARRTLRRSSRNVIRKTKGCSSSK